MKLLLTGIAVTGVLACAGCATNTAESPPATSIGTTAAFVSANRVTVHHNKAATRRETRRLLALAPLPPGATRISNPRHGLGGPALGTPATSSLIDAHHFWRVAMPMAEVWSYLKAHRPHGLTLSGTSSGGSVTGGITSRGIAWSEPDRPYAVGLETDVSLAKHGQVTLIRTDGVGEWIDPRPIRDTTKGPRLRVTIAGGCPKSATNVVGVRSPGPGLTQHLLPAGTPTAALICAYGGLNAKPQFRLTAHRVLDATAALQLAKQARKIPIGHTDGEIESCPLDDGSFDVVALSFSGRPDVDLADHYMGCATVANGHIVVNGALTLTRWVPQPWA